MNEPATVERVRERQKPTHRPTTPPFEVKPKHSINVDIRLDLAQQLAGLILDNRVESKQLQAFAHQLNNNLDQMDYYINGTNDDNDDNDE